MWTFCAVSGRSLLFQEERFKSAVVPVKTILALLTDGNLSFLIWGQIFNLRHYCPTIIELHTQVHSIYQEDTTAALFCCGGRLFILIS